MAASALWMIQYSWHSYSLINIFTDVFLPQKWNYKTNWKMIWNLVPCLNCRLHVFFINNQNFEIRLTLFSKSIKIAPKNCLLIVNFQSLIFGHLFSMLQPLSQWNVLFINSITCSLNVVLWYYVKFYVILPNLFYFQSQIAPINCLLVSIIAPSVYFQKFLQKRVQEIEIDISGYMKILYRSFWF